MRDILPLPFTTVEKQQKSSNMSQSPFQKFVAPKKNSKVKEEFRQEKKKFKKERAAYFDKVKEEKYQARIAAKNKGFGTTEKNSKPTKDSPAKSGTISKKELKKEKQQHSEQKK